MAISDNSLSTGSSDSLVVKTRLLGTHVDLTVAILQVPEGGMLIDSGMTEALRDDALCLADAAYHLAFCRASSKS